MSCKQLRIKIVAFVSSEILVKSYLDHFKELIHYKLMHRGAEMIINAQTKCSNGQ